ncbi:hypothetical protein H2201_003628 [Coniosporium apollinis]|uniref:Uncharacterized protein n=2 Tax=Coniosporium TaxID=2810619 RepID=A0ABQ9NUV6_9PEZI|nr:hypothetical protein H2199_002832 [Cladosporium sp. JES 115]KAJ9666194.1 hypothetical protein H2201_003628 [Coniosporium apollinis]
MQDATPLLFSGPEPQDPPPNLSGGPFYGRFPQQEAPAIGAAIRNLSPSKRLSGDYGHATKEQRDFNELRERLWAKRLLLREQRRELRKQRERASAAEARFISLVRRFYLQADQVQPRELLAYFGEVQAERDALGALDVDYDEAEDRYDALEWTLDHDESKALSEDKPQAPYEEHFRMGIVDQYLSHVGEAEMLKEQLNDLRMERADLFDPDQSFLDEMNQMSERLHQVEQKSRQLREEIMIADPRLEDLTHSDAWSLISVGEAPPVGSQIDRARSDTAVKTLANKFTDVRSRISHWILDALFDSSLERAHHKAILGRPFLDNRTWWSLVKQNWSRDGGAGNETKPVTDIPDPSPTQDRREASRLVSAQTVIAWPDTDEPAEKARSTSALDILRYQTATGVARTVKTI